jgi:hypothetical protein
MTQLFEYYNISDPALAACHDDFWQAETFTPRVNHTVTELKLRTYRLGSPGTITASIKATAVGGAPDGADIASGTTDGDTLTTEYAGEERAISLGAGVALTAGTKYAIVVRALTGDANNYMRWRHSGTKVYPRGSHWFSSDGGVTWEEDTTRDMMFEEYGTP